MSIAVMSREDLRFDFGETKVISFSVRANTAPSLVGRVIIRLGKSVSVSFIVVVLADQSLDARSKLEIHQVVHVAQSWIFIHLKLTKKDGKSEDK